MTALSRCALVLFVGVLVAFPALATIAGLGPMGHHSGAALLVRVVAVFAASASLAGVVGIAGFLYWLHVIVPAPALAMQVERSQARRLATQPA